MIINTYMIVVLYRYNTKNDYVCGHDAVIYLKIYEIKYIILKYITRDT